MDRCPPGGLAPGGKHSGSRGFGATLLLLRVGSLESCNAMSWGRGLAAPRFCPTCHTLQQLSHLCLSPRCDAYATEFDLEAEEYVPLPKVSAAQQAQQDQAEWVGAQEARGPWLAAVQSRAGA